MSIVFGNHECGATIAQAAGVQYNPEVDVCIARHNGPRLLGGVIFYNYTGKSISIHVAGFTPAWINPDMLWVTFDYPFNRLGCDALFGTLREDNQRAIDFDLKLGFKEVARIADVFPEGDMIVMKMLKSECRWLNMEPRELQRNDHGRKV